MIHFNPFLPDSTSNHHEEFVLIEKFINICIAILPVGNWNVLQLYYKMSHKRSSPFLFDRSSHSQVYFNIVALKNSLIFSKKHLYRSLFLLKLQAFRPIHKSLTQASFCEYCKNFKSSFFYRTPFVAASGLIIYQYLFTCFTHFACLYVLVNFSHLDKMIRFLLRVYLFMIR